MKNTTKKIVMSAMFAAVIFVLTRLVSVPSFSGIGNVNLGDCAVLLAAWLVSPKYAFLAAGVGSALADLTSAYAIYAPATFFIKGAMALVASLIHKKNKTLLSGIVAELIMIVGYLAFEGIFICGFKTALLNIPYNAVQGAIGLASAIVLLPIIKRIKRK